MNNYLGMFFEKKFEKKFEKNLKNLENLTT